MVYKFSLHRVLIILGIICCIYSVLFDQSSLDNVATNHHLTERPLIIDAGHGGADGGAVAADGTIESGINLDIALNLQTICNLYGVNVVMTRTEDDIAYPEQAKTIAEKKVADQKARLRLIRDYPNGIFMSIHQNHYPSSSVSGIHVFYGHSLASKQLGDLLQNNMNDIFLPATKRVAAEISDDIYLMKHAECPAVLIECGFLSNANDLSQLKNDSYRKKLAMVLFASYMQYSSSARNESNI